MKKLFVNAIALLLGFGAANAQDTVKTLYDGTEVNVTWENTLTIPAEKFADGIKVGDYISIALKDGKETLEIKGNGTWLPGSILQRIEGKSEYRAYITIDMLEALKKYGMEICGAGFNLTGVSVMNDGFQMPEGAIWGGYFWVENWNTLELWKTAFDSYDGERYLDIYMEAKNSDYILNVMTKFDDPAAVWANAANTVKTNTKATIDLKEINVKDALADVNALLCQLNPEGGDPFNVTAIALRKGSDVSTGISIIDTNDSEKIVTVYNMQGMPVRRDVAFGDALSDLPAGLYIVDGNKYMVK